MAPSLPLYLVIFSPTKLLPTGIIAQKDKHLNCIYLYQMGHKILTAYLTPLT